MGNPGQPPPSPQPDPDNPLSHPPPGPGDPGKGAGGDRRRNERGGSDKTAPDRPDKPEKPRPSPPMTPTRSAASARNPALIEEFGQADEEEKGDNPEEFGCACQERPDARFESKVGDEGERERDQSSPQHGPLP